MTNEICYINYHFMDSKTYYIHMLKVFDYSRGRRLNKPTSWIYKLYIQLYTYTYKSGNTILYSRTDREGDHNSFVAACLLYGQVERPRVHHIFT